MHPERSLQDLAHSSSLSFSEWLADGQSGPPRLISPGLPSCCVPHIRLVAFSVYPAAQACSERQKQVRKKS